MRQGGKRPSLVIRKNPHPLERRKHAPVTRKQDTGGISGETEIGDAREQPSPRDMHIHVYLLS